MRTAKMGDNLDVTDKDLKMNLPGIFSKCSISNDRFLDKEKYKVFKDIATNQEPRKNEIIGLDKAEWENAYAAHKETLDKHRSQKAWQVAC